LAWRRPSEKGTLFKELDKIIKMTSSAVKKEMKKTVKQINSGK